MIDKDLFAQVLLDTSLPQLDHLFDYRVPSALADNIRVGQRVRVPLRAGARQAFGYVVALSNVSAFGGNLSEISEIVSPVALLQPNIMALARTLADRAAGNANDILRLAIPTRQIRVEKKFVAEHPAFTAARPSPDPLTQDSNRAAKRESILPRCFPVRLRTGEWTAGWAADIAELAKRTLREGRSSIISVPDHHDLTMLADALGAAGLEDSILRVDSQQSNAARYLHFLKCLHNEPVIVIGNRSAIYSPAHNLGSIVVWDDGDPLFNEPLSPYVHTRDAALVRSELEGSDLYFFAHTPSAEAQRLVNLGYLTPRELSSARASVLLSEHVLGNEDQTRLPSVAQKAIAEGLKYGPVLVQVASPGGSLATFCKSCGTRQRCLDCQGPLELIADESFSTRCRWCATERVNHSCTQCGGSSFRKSGAGSQGTAEQMQKQFPRVPILTSDGHTRRVLVDTRPAIVVATRGAEPLAIGGFANVILLDAERILAAESLRAEEEALRVWSNAAALCRPESKVILVGAGVPVAKAFARRSIVAWLNELLTERKQLRYPPSVRIATVRGAPQSVNNAVESLGTMEGVDFFGAGDTSDGFQTVIVRFDYASGPEVARKLRSALIADAARARRPRDQAPNRSRVVASLRLHFDDYGAFDERKRLAQSVKRAK